jgi:hypothetical protein
MHCKQCILLTRHKLMHTCGILKRNQENIRWRPTINGPQWFENDEYDAAHMMLLLSIDGLMGFIFTLKLHLYSKFKLHYSIQQFQLIALYSDHIVCLVNCTLYTIDAMMDWTGRIGGPGLETRDWIVWARTKIKKNKNVIIILHNSYTH